MGTSIGSFRRHAQGASGEMKSRDGKCSTCVRPPGISNSKVGPQPNLVAFNAAISACAHSRPSLRLRIGKLYEIIKQRYIQDAREGGH